MPNISYFMQNFLNQASCCMKRGIVLQHEARGIVLQREAQGGVLQGMAGPHARVIFSHKNHPIFLVFSLFCVIV